VDEQKKQTIFDAPKVIAIGIASPAATLLTSRFGIAGTLLGLALSAMILTAVADFLKVYLARTSHAAHAAATAATKVPGAMRAPRLLPPALFFRRKRRTGTKAPYHGFSSPPGGRWRRWSLLVGRSVVAAGISFLLGLGAVTALEHSAGKSLSCLVWEECPVQSSNDEGGGSSDQSTRPSIFGGGPGAGSGTAAEVRPAGTQQGPTPRSDTLKAPSPQTPSKGAGSVDSSWGQAISGGISRSSRKTRLTTIRKKSTSSRAPLATRKNLSGENTGMAALWAGGRKLPWSTRFPRCLGAPELSYYL